MQKNEQSDSFAFMITQADDKLMVFETLLDKNGKILEFTDQHELISLLTDLITQAEK